jgi:hypothetical protein
MSHFHFVTFTFHFRNMFLFVVQNNSDLETGLSSGNLGPTVGVGSIQDLLQKMSLRSGPESMQRDFRGKYCREDRTDERNYAGIGRPNFVSEDLTDAEYRQR